MTRARLVALALLVAASAENSDVCTTASSYDGDADSIVSSGSGYLSCDTAIKLLLVGLRERPRRVLERGRDGAGRLDRGGPDDAALG